MPQSKKNLTLDRIYTDLREFMKKKKIRHVTLAQELGCSEQALSNKLRRKGHFTSKSAQRFADAFEIMGYHINVTFLLKGEGCLCDSLLQDDYVPSQLDQAIMKLIKLRREHSELREKYQELLLENESLRGKMQEIQCIITGN